MTRDYRTSEKKTASESAAAQYEVHRRFYAQSKRAIAHETCEAHVLGEGYRGGDYIMDIYIDISTYPFIYPSIYISEYLYV